MTSLPPLRSKFGTFNNQDVAVRHLQYIYIYGIERVQRDLYVCLLDITVSPMKRAEPIEVPFGVWTRVGQGTMY